MSYISRITSLKHFDNVLLGRDLANALKPGTVYGIINILGVITLEEIGEQAQSTPHTENKTIGQIAVEGVYMLTKGEYEEQLKSDI